MKTRGFGSVYQPRYKDRNMGQYRSSPTWWIAYYYRGVKRRESSHSANRVDALRLLRRRMEEMGRGRLIGPDAERISFEDLATMVLDDYRVNSRKSIRRAEAAVKRLREFFGLSRAMDITGDRVAAYIRMRQENSAKPATIRYELAILKRMFTLAIRAEKLMQRPYIPSIEVRNTRSGFFEEPEFRAVLHHLPEHLRPLVEFDYLTGWRMGEILSLQWRQVDFQAETVRLEPGTTKNDDGRVFPFAKFPAMRVLLKHQRERTEALQRATGQIVSWVFHRDGKRIKYFRRAWVSACKKAGAPGRIRHDFRRTAVRNLERAGVPRSVAMKSIYRRYAIVSEGDLSEGVAKLAALHEAHMNLPSARITVPFPQAGSERTGKAQAKQGQVKA